MSEGVINVSVDVVLTNERMYEALDLLEESAPWARFILPCTDEELADAMGSAEILCGRPTTALLKEARNLRWVQVTSAGVDRFPLGELRDRGIVLTNARGMHGDTIADHVMALILARTRQLPLRFENQKQRRWERGGQSRELAGATMGVVGLGGIGRKVAQRALGFEMEVVGTRRSGGDVPGVKRVVTPDRIIEILPVCEYLAICCPLTPDTEGLIGERELSALPSGAYLVNIARGMIVDEGALVTALKKGHLDGAGLDVFTEEPLSPESPLWDMDNVLITPHVAGQQSNYARKAAGRFAENLRRWHQGKPLKWVVDYDIGY